MAVPRLVPAGTAVPNWSVPVCRAAAEQLGPRRWQIVSLSYGGGLSADEIGRRLSITAAAVRAEMAHCLRVVAALVLDGVAEEPASA